MDMNELLKEYNVELDEKKQELCCELQHPLLINGTTGSGKTFLLLARNAYLMKVEEVEPSAILNIVQREWRRITAIYTVMMNGCLPLWICTALLIGLSASMIK